MKFNFIDSPFDKEVLLPIILLFEEDEINCILKQLEIFCIEILSNIYPNILFSILTSFSKLILKSLIVEL